MNLTVTEAVTVIRDPSADFSEKVDAAAKLWTLIENAQAALEEFKTQAREKALATRSSDSNKVLLNGAGLSQCQVTFPPPTLKINEGVNVDAEKAALGPYFNSVYEVRLGLRKSSLDFLDGFPVTVRRHMADRTTLVNNPPRVSLKTLPGVEEMK